MTRLLRASATLPLAALLLAGCASTEPTTYRVYYLGGQSNMDGYGFDDDLSIEQRHVSDDVMIFTGMTVLDDDASGGVGVWEPLQPGHGTGVRSDGVVVQRWKRFGPELSFGRTMARKMDDARVAIVKYSLGGSGLAPGVGYGSWDPDYGDGDGINQYDNALKTIANALSVTDIDGDGEADDLVPAGIVWMQGEADAHHSQEAADDYEANLTRLMGLLREALGGGDLPVAIGKITDSGMADDGVVMDFIGTVQQAQANFVESDACAAYVTITDDLDYLDDGWHYDSAGYLILGAAFAEAIAELYSSCASR